MVWRVKFQKRIARSAAKADVTVAASRKTRRAVLRMTLPCGRFLVALRQPGLRRHPLGAARRELSLSSTPDRVKMPNCGEFVRASFVHLEPAARLRHYPADKSPVSEPEKNTYGSPGPGE